jgi:ABC-type dipeptide/oligopeptide/nickel transport system permease component
MMMHYLSPLGPWHLVDFYRVNQHISILLHVLLIATPVFCLAIVLTLLFIAMLSGLPVIVFDW